MLRHARVFNVIGQAFLPVVEAVGGPDVFLGFGDVRRLSRVRADAGAGDEGQDARHDTRRCGLNWPMAQIGSGIENGESRAERSRRDDRREIRCILMEHACARFNASLWTFTFPRLLKAAAQPTARVTICSYKRNHTFRKKKKKTHTLDALQDKSAVTRFSPYNTSARTTREERPSTFDGRASMKSTAAFVTALYLAGTNAAYVHGDPAGVAHPGRRSDPSWSVTGSHPLTSRAQARL